MRLEGKTALVTAAGQGIGRATVLALAAEGATVWATDVNAGLLEAYQGTARVHTAVLNVLDKDAIHALVDSLPALNVLFNCAGVVQNGSILQATDDDWSFAFNLNARAQFWAIQAVLPKMLDNGGGSIINIASIGGLQGGRAGAAYVASKHAVIGLTKNTAFMYAKKGIRCNAVAPGAVATNIAQSMGDISTFGQQTTGVGMAINPAFGTPAQIASVAVFLASDHANFVNGAVVTADGGWTSY